MIIKNYAVLIFIYGFKGAEEHLNRFYLIRKRLNKLKMMRVEQFLRDTEGTNDSTI
jgi:hypothetical protein